MTRLLVVLCGVALCACEIGPPDSGVNFTLDARRLSSTLVSQTAHMTLDVSGDEVFSKNDISVGDALGSGELRVHYEPRITSGVLRFRFALVDGGGMVEALAVSPATMIKPGSATTVALTFYDVSLPGAPCSAAADCRTPGGCVDGYCCDTTCTDQCRACDVAGAAGTCTPVASGPPHGQRTACTGFGTCAGVCAADSPTTCTYPTSECAPSSCSDNQTELRSVCNAGSCLSAPANCGSFACSVDRCVTHCDADAGTGCNAGLACVASRCLRDVTVGYGRTVAPFGGSIVAIASGRVDTDSVDDIAIAFGGGIVAVYHNNIDAFVNMPVDAGVPVPSDVAIGNVGGADTVMAAFSSINYLLGYNWSPPLTAMVPSQNTTVPSVNRILIGDFDGAAGNEVLVTHDVDPGKIDVFSPIGSTKLSAAGTYTLSARPVAMRWLNRATSSGTVAVLEESGLSFLNQTGGVTVGARFTNGRQMTTLDLNGDSLGDVVVATDTNLVMYLGKTATTVDTTPWATIPLTLVISLDGGDFSGDGFGDLVIARTAALPELWIGTGLGDFPARHQLGTANATYVYAGQLVSDIRPEIVVAAGSQITMYTTTPRP